MTFPNAFMFSSWPLPQTTAPLITHMINPPQVPNIPLIQPQKN